MVYGYVISVEQLISPSKGKRQDGILDEVIANVDPFVINIAEKAGKQVISTIEDRFTRFAFSKIIYIHVFLFVIKYVCCVIRYFRHRFLLTSAYILITSRLAFSKG